MSAAPAVPLHDVLKTLDLATGPEEPLRTALMAAVNRVAEAQRVTLDPQRVAAAAHVVQHQASAPSVALPVATGADAPIWQDRPRDEAERQTRLAQLSRGIRGWFRRRDRDDQGKDVPLTRATQVISWIFPTITWASIFFVPMPLFAKIFLPTAMMHGVLVACQLYSSVLGRRYRFLLPAVVDDTLRQRIQNDHLVRHRVIHLLHSEVPTLLQGDLDAMADHWKKQDATLQEEGQSQATATQVHLRQHLLNEPVLQS